MKKLIVANWKMNPSSEAAARKLFESVKKGVRAAKQVEVVICSPFVYLSLLKGLTLGAQDVFYQEKGAFTGEVSSLMLKDLQVTYVILGHSEVRRLGEKNETVNKKITAALSAGLKPILCVGENKGKNKEHVLQQQVVRGLKHVSSQDIKNVVIAYEPVFAIGTGKNCSVEQTMAAVKLIKGIIQQLCGESAAKKVRILYGGSVNSENASLYIKRGRVHGLLVGGSSLNAKDFIKIVRSIDKNS